MHYILHYSSQIVSFGLLIYAWTMSHEVKLPSVIKRASRMETSRISAAPL